MTDYTRLEEIYNEINVLIAEDATDKSASFTIWYEKVKRFLQDYYGKDSIECMVFERTWFEFQEIDVKRRNIDMTERIAVCKEILVAIKILFRKFLEEMNASEN